MSAPDTQFPQAATGAENFDPGLTQKYTGVLTRVLTREGRFNVRRAGSGWRDANLYMFMISVPWPVFWTIVFSAFLCVNILFATMYDTLGVSHVKGAEAADPRIQFLNLFFFSAHTLTTVGYGNMYPNGPLANLIASSEALVGLMGFAIATGLLFGRFSRPSVRIGFSPTMAIAPYGDGKSLQFRVVNRRSNNLIELQARVMLMTVEPKHGHLGRKYSMLELERDQVLFFPLTWTVVHPITDKSPLHGKSEDDLKRLQAEILVMMRGYDETFGQTVYARYSYRYDEITWGSRFSTAFDVDHKGDLQLWIDRVGHTEPAPLREAAK